MKTVIRHGNDAGYLNPIDSGIRFGSIGNSLGFSILEPTIAPTILVFFNTINNDNKKPGELEINHEAGTIRINFYNPKPDTSNFLRTPHGIVINENGLFGIMFCLDMLEGDFYKLSYEFYWDSLSNKNVEVGK
jgi:hypothetical protein